MVEGAGASFDDLDRIHDELIRKLALPGSFGRNLDALHECLRDLPDWMPASTDVVVLADLGVEPVHADRIVEPTFVEVLLFAAAGMSWATPTSRNPAIPFHTIIQGTEADLTASGKLPPAIQCAPPAEALLPGSLHRGAVVQSSSRGARGRGCASAPGG